MRAVRQSGLGSSGISHVQGGLDGEIPPGQQAEGVGVPPDGCIFESESLPSDENGDPDREGGPKQPAKRKRRVLGSTRNLMRRRTKALFRASEPVGRDEQDPQGEAQGTTRSGTLKNDDLFFD